VAGHPYHVCDASGISPLKAKYPYISTEFACPNSSDWNVMCALQGDNWGWVKWHEANKISWFIWSSPVTGVLSDARSRGYTWTPDSPNPPTIVRPSRGRPAITSANVLARMFDLKGRAVVAQRSSTRGIQIRIMQTNPGSNSRVVVLK
jgi:hypothetical protein